MEYGPQEESLDGSLMHTSQLVFFSDREPPILIGRLIGDLCADRALCVLLVLLEQTH